MVYLARFGAGTGVAVGPSSPLRAGWSAGRMAVSVAGIGVGGVIAVWVDSGMRVAELQAVRTKKNKSPSKKRNADFSLLMVCGLKSALRVLPTRFCIAVF